MKEHILSQAMSQNLAFTVSRSKGLTGVISESDEKLSSDECLTFVTKSKNIPVYGESSFEGSTRHASPERSNDAEEDLGFSSDEIMEDALAHIAVSEALARERLRTLDCDSGSASTMMIEKLPKGCYKSLPPREPSLFSKIRTFVVPPKIEKNGRKESSIQTYPVLQH